MTLKGSYPFAVLHCQKTSGIPAAIDLARRLSKEMMTKKEAIDYVHAVVKTDGHPELLDMYASTSEA